MYIDGYGPVVVYYKRGACFRNILQAFNLVTVPYPKSYMRTSMVKEGLLDYHVEFLNEYFRNVSLYSLEHSVALLMNLCLEDEAKYYCSTRKEKVVGLIRKLLEDPHTSYLPYINGVLLTVLSDSNVNDEARKQSLDKILQQLVQSVDDEYLQRQMRYIITMWFGRQLKYFVGDDDGPPESEDFLESELNSDPEQGCVINKKDPERKFSTDCFERKKGAFFSSAGIREGSALKGGTQKVLRTPFCYMEACRSFHDGSKTCGCLRCTPGKSRYSCGCYDAMAEEIDNICRGLNLGRTKYAKKTCRRGSHDAKTATGKVCAICGDVICECAFESRPKIHRTPPKT